jgi:hypothetical protein
MKKILIMAVIGLLGAGFLYTQYKTIKPDKKTKPTPVPTINAVPAQNYVTIANIIANKKNSSCESGSANGGKSNLYTSGKKLKIDTISQNGEATHILSDGDWFYVWSSKNQGLKIKAGEFLGEDATRSSQILLQAFSNVNNGAQLKCTDWVADEKTFILPQDVVFSDFTETMKKLKPTS